MPMPIPKICGYILQRTKWLNYTISLPFDITVTATTRTKLVVNFVCCVNKELTNALQLRYRPYSVLKSRPNAQFYSADTSRTIFRYLI